MNSYMKEYSAKQIANVLGGARQTGDSWSCCCPAHDDERPSLSITDSKDGKILVKCHANCLQEEVIDELKNLDLWPDAGRVCTTYDYVDANSNLIYQVIRFPNKEFRHRRPDGQDSWFWDMQGVKKLPYRLPELLTAIKAGEAIFIVEGEKDCENLAKQGIVAITNSGGAGKWKDEYSQYFEGAKQVIVLPDNDDVGRDHAIEVAASLNNLGIPVKIVHLPNLSPKADVSDWLTSGGTKEQLLQLCADAPVWVSESPTMENPINLNEHKAQPTSPRLDDIGNAERFQNMFGTEVLWVKSLGKFFVWTGKNWVIDDLEKVLACAKQVARSIFEEAEYG